MRKFLKEVLAMFVCTLVAVVLIKLYVLYLGFLGIEEKGLLVDMWIFAMIIYYKYGDICKKKEKKND